MPDLTSSDSRGLGAAAGEPYVDLREPALDDARDMWRMAQESRVLDVGSPYAYLLACRDFAASSAVATVDGALAGFLTGYARPVRPDTLMVSQVAVGAGYRGRGLARRMLDHVVDRLGSGTRYVEATITPGNDASTALFTSFATAHHAPAERQPLFAAALFPDDHEAELLFRIGPLG
jgi:diaminobutyrate acetyltransferase